MRAFATAVAALLLCGGFVRASAQTAVPPPKPAVPAADAPAAPMSCGDCHADEAKAFRANAHGHGKTKDGAIPNAVCESCHGDGKAHAEGGGDKALIVTPRGKAGSDKTCLACHDILTNRISRHAGMHANSAAVNCLTCHSMHASEPRTPHLLAKRQLDLCASCHASQAASFRGKPFAHRIGRGGTECSSCHEPHGRTFESLRTTITGELPCLSCHFEKRGPFVFAHAAGVASGDCLTCHEAHGSSNPKMLKRATVAQLCIECHSTLTSNTLGSQPPSFHNLNLARYQNCTTCHVAVHGSNRDPQLLK